MSFADLQECEAEIQRLESCVSVMIDRKANIERELHAARAIHRCPDCGTLIRICADVPDGQKIAHTQAECERCHRSYYVHVKFIGGDRRDPASYQVEFISAGYNIGSAMIGDLNVEDLDRIYKAAVQEKRRRCRLGSTGLLFGKKAAGDATG